MGLDRLRLVAGDDEHLVDTCAEQAGKDVFKNGPAMDRQHWLGQLVGEFLHAGAFAGGEDDSFHSFDANRGRELADAPQNDKQSSMTGDAGKHRSGAKPALRN
jgi:hypothetical protein